METIFLEEAEANVLETEKQLEAQGYCKFDFSRSHVQQFNSLVLSVERKHKTTYPRFDDYIVEAPTCISYAGSMHARSNLEGRYIICDAQWVPGWIVSMIKHYGCWERSITGLSGLTSNTSYWELQEVVKAGLEGDMDTVDAFTCMKELQEKPSTINVYDSMPKTLNELRTQMGLPPL